MLCSNTLRCTSLLPYLAAPVLPRPDLAQTEKPVVSIEKKRGKDTFSAAYGIKDEATTLSWQHKPFKVGRGQTLLVQGSTPAALRRCTAACGATW